MTKEEIINRIDTAISEMQALKNEVQRIPEEIGGDSVPNADVAPVIHGYWKPVKGGNVACSRCGHLEPPQHDHYNFCPNCGAKMDEEAQKQ